jgi:uncharacterized protein YjiS (DUF1127 family)
MREAASFMATQLGSSEAGLLSSIRHSAQRAYRVWRNRREIAVLSEFDDHMLADLGLTRGDVADALDLPFSHNPGRELQARAAHNIGLRWNV